VFRSRRILYSISRLEWDYGLRTLMAYLIPPHYASATLLSSIKILWSGSVANVLSYDCVLVDHMLRLHLHRGRIIIIVFNAHSTICTTNCSWRMEQNENLWSATSVFLDDLFNSSAFFVQRRIYYYAYHNKSVHSCLWDFGQVKLRENGIYLRSCTFLVENSEDMFRFAVGPLKFCNRTTIVIYYQIAIVDPFLS
jgi:hypothetical protein